MSGPCRLFAFQVSLAGHDDEVVMSFYDHKFSSGTTGSVSGLTSLLTVSTGDTGANNDTPLYFRLPSSIRFDEGIVVGSAVEDPSSTLVLYEQ